MKLPQVSLRELLLLVVIASLGCGWWVEHRRAKHFEFEFKSYRQMWQESNEIGAKDAAIREGLEQVLYELGCIVQWSGVGPSIKLLRVQDEAP